MKKLKLFFACLLMAVLSIGQVWAEDFSTTYSYGGTDWTRSGAYSDESTYYKTDGTDDFVATVSGIFTGKTITSNVVITLDVACYGNGDNPTSGKFGIYTSSACTQQVTAAQSGTLPTDKYFKSTIYTVTAANAASFSDDLAIKVVGGTKLIRFRSFQVAFSYTAGTPSYTITAVSNNESWGTVSGTTTITASPKTGYRVKAGNEGYTVTSGTADVTNNGDNTFSVSASADCTVQINFEAIPSYTVTWNNHGIETTSQVYDGEKPVFPSPNPTSCDATSTTFIGWATAAWDGKATDLEDSKLSGITIYTSASTMPVVKGAVKYYAVYAKVTAGTPVPHDGPSFSRSGTDNTVTDGYTLTTQAEAKTGYYQDGSGTTRYLQVLNATTPIFSETPNSITVTAKIGGGTGNTDLANPVYAQLLDKTGALIGTAAVVTEHITTNTGDTYSNISLSTTGITSAYGLRISHVKESGYNVRYYSFSLSYTTGGVTYSDYMTTCATAGTCEAPSFSPEAGTFNGAQDITLVTSTPSAHIYYTLDGSDPDDGSDEYTAAIHIAQNTKIKAITYADGLNESTISEGDFKIRYTQPTLTPSAAPVDGKYTSAITVAIAAEGADAIYYTLDGTTPTNASTLYTVPVELSTAGTKTIKAIAVKANYESSNVVTGTYVMDLPYGSIDEFVTAKPNTAKDLVFEVADNCVITGISGKSIYVQDASGKGMIIFNNSGYGELEFHVGDRIVGTVNGKYQAFNGQHEITTAVFAEGVTFTAVSRPTPVSVSAIDETAFNTNTQILVKIEGLYYKSSDNKTHKFATTSGGSTEYTIYDQFGMLSGKTMPATDVACNLIGILSVYGSTYQLLPVLTTDIAADADAADPTVSPAGGADEENAVMAAAVEITAAADTKVDGLASKTVDINSTTPVEVSVTVTRDFYRSVNFSCGWYKAAAAKYNINGQGATTEGAVVAKVAGVEAATAAEGDEVHVFITPEAHFHLATILVNGVAPTVVTAGEEYSFTMPDEAVTIAVTYTQDQQATLTFAKGEATGTEDAPTAITDYVGETVQLPANPFTYTGHKFIGWSCDGGTTKLAAGADYVLSENKAFVAYWAAIPTFNDADHEWRLATSLEAGNYYVIGSASQDKTASKTITSGYMSEIDSEIEDGVIAYNALGANTAIFLLGGNSTDGWTLTEVTTDDVLGTTANKNVSWNAGTQVWAISIAEGGNATIGGTSRILHNAANTGKRFTTYTSDLTASMLLPQLYVWAEKVFKLRYDANGGTNAPAATLPVAGKATVTSDVPDAPANKVFDKWNTKAEGDGEDKAAGDKITISDADVTIYAIWRDPNSVTITYDANGGTLKEGESDIAPANATEGEEYALESNVYEKEGYMFGGWKAFDEGHNDLTINSYGEITVPATNVTVQAQWVSLNVSDFALVTNVNQLKDGDKVYIVSAGDKNFAMGTQNATKDYRDKVDIQKTADKKFIVLPDGGTEPVEFTLGKDGENWTFYDGANYIYASSSNSNDIKSGTMETAGDNGKWAITIDGEGNTSIVAQGTNERNTLQYNSANPRFSCYNGATQQAVVLYKKMETIREAGVAPGVWGTICPKKEIANAVGASFFKISYVEYHSGVPYKVFYDEIAEGENLAAGQPYLFQADEDATAIKGFKIGDDATSAINDHGFKGVLENETISVVQADVDAYKYYIVYNNEIRLCGVGQFLVRAERAYLDLSDPTVEKQYKAPVAGRRRVALTNNAAEEAQGFENLDASEKPLKVMIEGQLYILRGERVYDATGRLVK